MPAMRIYCLIIIIFFICLVQADGNAGEISPVQQERIEQQTVILTKNLFDKIINQQGFSAGEEERFFGKNGGILGESVYKTLRRDLLFASKQFNTPLSILLVKKLHCLLKDKKRFTFALARNVQTLDLKNVPRNGVNASMLLFVRAIPDTDDRFFNDIANGINFIFSVCYTSNRHDTVYIDLVNSYIGHEPIYKVLGFSGDYASGLKLTPETLKFLTTTIEKEY